MRTLSDSSCAATSDCSQPHERRGYTQLCCDHGCPSPRACPGWLERTRVLRCQSKTRRGAGRSPLRQQRVHNRREQRQDTRWHPAARSCAAVERHDHSRPLSAERQVPPAWPLVRHTWPHSRVPSRRFVHFHLRLLAAPDSTGATLAVCSLASANCKSVSHKALEQTKAHHLLDSTCFCAAHSALRPHAGS